MGMEVEAPQPSSEVLEISRLTHAFGGNYALRQVDLSLHAGEVVALLGENGAGKSTLIKVLSGLYTPTAGTIRLGDRTYHHGITAAQGRAGGLTFVHQDLGLLGDLSVAENIAHVAGFQTRHGFVSWRRQRALAEGVLHRWHIDIDPDARVDRLTAADRALVAIGRALARDARVVVLDEPTATLPHTDVNVLYEALERLQAGGVAVLYVTHRLAEVMRVADRAAVLRDGRIVGDVSVAETTEAQLVELIVGRSLAHVRFDKPQPRADVALEFESLDGKAARQTSFTLRRGEILALVGLIGAGQRSVGRIVAGVEDASGTRIRLGGRDFWPRSPAAAQRCGVVHLPGDRISEASFPDLASATNLVLHAGPALRRIHHARERERAVETLKAWEVTPDDPAATLATLSGGNQQKVVVGKWMGTGANVIVAEDPTAGVDVGARAAIHERLVDAARTGRSLLLVSSDADEVAAISHRALVFRDGSVAQELTGPELTVDRIVLECYRADPVSEGAAR